MWGHQGACVGPEIGLFSAGIIDKYPPATCSNTVQYVISKPLYDCEPLSFAYCCQVSYRVKQV